METVTKYCGRIRSEFFSYRISNFAHFPRENTAIFFMEATLMVAPLVVEN